MNHGEVEEVEHIQIQTSHLLRDGVCHHKYAHRGFLFPYSKIHPPQAPWFRSANILQCKFPGIQGTPATGSRAFAKGTFQFQSQVSARVAKLSPLR